MARAQNAAFGTEGFLHRLAESNADIFDRVMLIHVEIATRVHVQIKRAVPCNQLEHMIEEADSRGDARLSASIQIQLQANVGLACLAMNYCSAWHAESFFGAGVQAGAFHSL